MLEADLTNVVTNSAALADGMNHMKDRLDRLSLSQSQTPQSTTPPGTPPRPVIRSARMPRSKIKRINLAQIDREEREDFTAKLQAVTSDDDEEDEDTAQMTVDDTAGCGAAYKIRPTTRREEKLMVAGMSARQRQDVEATFVNRLQVRSPGHLDMCMF